MQEKEASSQGFLPHFQHFATQAIHVGQEPEQWTSRALVPPISLSTTFKQGAPGQHSGFEYSRSGNPTRNCLEKAVAALDGAKYCLAFASGLAATVTITHLLKAGDQIICMDDVYGGTNRYFRQVASEFGLKSSFVDCSKIKLLEAAITPETKLVWIETPTNPTQKMIDIEACAHIVHKHGDIILVVDNTFMSPYFQRPLALGADICMYSATKYMNGHSDVVMGLVSVNCESLHNRLRFLQNSLGAVPSPIDCYLCNRGLKTLHVRMEKHFKNGMAVAQFLESNPCVEKVIYPGLPSHPQHELAKRQCTGCTGMVTFYIKGTLQHAEIFLKNLKLFTLAESLGGFESLVELPAIMTHASVLKSDRHVLGISDTLIRLSVGLEDEEDLLEDLDQALKAASAGVPNSSEETATIENGP
ncbi:cystathionine gamma-lyase isoform X1 [Symphalangus syndactylus]|uniref:cystathionine gamma-lyase isoform X1 n=1 Tax=Symphalangus syndactylus TaxID=9590 RepID=UPI00300502C3